MRSKLILPLLTLSIVNLNAGNPEVKNYYNQKDVFGTRVFIENKGQFNSSVNSAEKIKYAFENGGENIYFTEKGLIYKLTKQKTLTEEQREELEKGKAVDLTPQTYYINMNWVNSNSNIQIEQSEKQNNYFSYGNAEYKSFGYKKITYKNVYNNIDIEYTIPEDKDYGIKYNVILHPGANATDIKIAYTGDTKGFSINSGGDVVIKTPLENIVEHAPKSFSENKAIGTKFTLQNNLIGFGFNESYNTSKTLIIDPWVTNLALGANNYGYDVDYDNGGNLFVYGGTAPYRTAKYNSSGVLQWTFMGIVVVPAWNGGGAGTGNFVVNRSNGKCFISVGLGGNKIIRIDANGIYDGLITPTQATWLECWDLGYDCVSGNIYGFGGGGATNQSGSIINQTTGAIAPTTFNPANLNKEQDIVNNCIDDQGNIFIYYNSLIPNSVDDHLCRINPTFNGLTWGGFSTYNVMNEPANKMNYVGFFGGLSNGFNCLAVSGSYVYFYDGKNLAAYNKTTGVKVGFTAVAAHVGKQQGGVAVDDCENVYIGGNGSILSYKFNGANFIAQASIPLAATSVNKYVYDMKLDKGSNLLYVSGSGFAGTYSAIHSLACTNNQYSVTPFCSSAVASVTTTINNPIYSYTWTNSGGVFSNTNNSASSTNTVINLSTGNYTVSMQINAPCGPIYTTTFAIAAPSGTITTTPKTCTALGSATIATSGGVNPITFKWSGSVSTGSVVNNMPNGVQTVTITDATGCKNVYTYTIDFANTLTTTVTGTNVSCFGGANGSASATVTGGGGNYTYLWNTTQTTSSLNGLKAGTYVVVTSDGTFCSNTTTIVITQPPALSLTINSSTTAICAGGTINLNSFAAGGVGPYTYTWNPGPVGSAHNVTQNTAGNYNYVLNSTDANGCKATNNIDLKFHPIPLVTASSQTICVGQKATVSALGADTYVWNPGNIQGNIFTSSPTVNQYLTVTGTSNLGCSAKATSTIVVNQLPVPTISNSNNKGCVPLCMTFTAGNANGPIQNCTWEFGDGSFASNVINTDRCFKIAGDYTVKATVTDNNGCVATMTTTLEAYPIPVADFNYAPLRPILNQDPEVTFTDASHGAVIKTWDWYFTNLPKPHSNLQHPTYIYTEAGTYAIALVVKSDHGCSDTMVKTIIVGDDYGIYVPDVFTPNNDGVNDVFQPKGFGVTKYELRIFNRWGEELFMSNDFALGWDGMYKGKLSKTDTYAWKINLTNNFGKAIELTGKVNLIK